ncbi:hypothetical protein [Kineosporia sp. NBRC 101731]|uniref:hypothetical protein n=1 Tax=Kineosporia sp. NBRC 101731 TaxID=3032199 RepID=UPI0024A0F041|nr:hypothetical protein [Kineosporia sp. NBRC 101731]GLY32519.1 hypothetical protein Kisp02_58840 [Kineosporia sp. NBRC 101731]
MSQSAHVYKIDGRKATALEPTKMVDHGLLESQHLETWVVEHPEVLGGNVRIVTQQFSRWGTSGGQFASERLDVLGLDSTGQLVIVELKRDGDKRVHLQALTYAALVARFDKEMLGAVHAEYLNQQQADSSHTAADGFAQLSAHVEGDWDEDLITRPRIVLIAERFPPQVLTTVTWLSELAPTELEINCVELNLFRDADTKALIASFQRIFPIDDMTDRVLGPLAQAAGTVSEKLAQRTRNQRSVAVIADNALVPEGARLELSLESLIKPDLVTRVREWLAEDPKRHEVYWRNDRQKPLIWKNAPEVDGWSATKLAQDIVTLATGVAPTFSGPDAWTYEERSLYVIANEFQAQQE